MLLSTISDDLNYFYLQGSFSYKLPADDVLKAYDNPILNADLADKIIIVSTLLGSITVFIPITRYVYFRSYFLYISSIGKDVSQYAYL